MSRYPQFDRSRLLIKPLDQRQHDIQHASLLPLEHQPPPLPPEHQQSIATLGERLVAARAAGALG